MATPANLEQQIIPTIALVGRVNVGKSSLFNRLIEEQKAMVSDIPGTTRTNNEGLILWRGKHIRIIDTGGLTFSEDVPLEADIIKQTEYAMTKADLIIFVADATVGILPQEIELSKRLRKHKGIPLLLVANKVDSNKIEPNIYTPEWRKLQLGEPFPVSAASGRNLGDLLDKIYDVLITKEKIPVEPPPKGAPSPIHVCIIGKPNAGKSSLFNKLIGEDRVIVNDMAHTTREPYDTIMTYEYTEGDVPQTYTINFIDTAGIRRKARVERGLEREGVVKSIQSVEKTDIVLFVIDGSEPLSHQDMQLGGLLEKRAKSVIILVNKWDLSEDNSDAHRNEVRGMIFSYFPHLSFAPMVFVSGKTGYRAHQLFPLIIKVWEGRNTHVANRALEQLLERAIKEHLPARGKGTRHPELLGLRQIGTAPPVFELFVKVKTSLHRSYLNFLENKLRESFGFFGTPLIIKLTKVKR